MHSLIEKYLLPLLFLLTTVSPLYSELYKSQEQALQEVFNDADTVLRKTLFLDEAQVKTLRKKSKSALNSPVVFYYLGLKEGKPLRYAFFEDQVVRTKKTVVMVVVSPANTLEKVEVLAFYEPADYLPIPKWFDLFKGHSLNENLYPGKDIYAVTGATLSVRVLTAIARRMLAIQEFIGKENP